MAQTSTLANLIVKISGNTAQLIGELNKAESRTEKFQKNVTKNLKRGAIGAGIALAGIGVASIKMAADFDKSLREVRTLLPTLSDEGFDKLRGDVLAFSSEVGIATNEVVPALYQAISAGIPPENALTFLKGAADLAIGGVTNLTSATDLLSSATNAFGKEAGTTGDIADSFFTAVKLGKTTVEEIAASFSTAAPLAAAVGVSLDELLASVSAITLSGAPTAQAFTQVRAALLSLQRATPDMQKALEDMGFATGQAALDALGLQGTLQGLRDSAEATNTPLIKLTGRAEGMQAILALTGDNAKRAGDLLAQFGQKSGASAAAVATMNESTSRLWDTFKANLNVALIELGTVILPELNKVLIIATDLIPEFKQAISDAAKAIVEEFGPAFKFWADAFAVADGDVSRLDDALIGLGKIAADVAAKPLRDMASAGEAVTEVFFGQEKSANAGRVAIRRLGEANLIARRKGQEFADTLLDQGIAFKKQMESAGNAARSIRDWHVANDGAAQAALDAAANIAEEEAALKKLRGELLATTAASLSARVITDVDFGIEDAIAQAQAAVKTQGGASIIESLLAPLFTGSQVSKLGGIGLGFREMNERAAETAKILSGGGGGLSGALDATVEKLGEFFDTGAIVFWADLNNQIREAERAAADFNATNGDTIHAFEVLTEAEFAARRELELWTGQAIAAKVAGEALAAAATAGAAPFGFIISRDAEGNRVFTARTHEDPGVLLGGQLRGGIFGKGFDAPGSQEIRPGGEIVNINAPVTINAGSLDGEAMLASLEAAGVL